MTIIPDYYQTFHCLADRCRHNCCIGWEIDIDPDTYARYTAVKGDFGKRLHDGIVHGDQPCFRLDEHERCVFLNDRGLCDVIRTLGEDALCDICTDHPRFRTYLGDDLRLGLGLCCEAACYLILNSPVRFIDADTGDAVQVDTAVPPFSDVRTPTDWAMFYRSLERMDPAWDAYLDKLGVCSSFAEERGALWERLTAYFMFRHAHPHFAAHAAAVILTLAEGAGEDELFEICRLYSAEIEYSDENLGAVLNNI